MKASLNRQVLLPLVAACLIAAIGLAALSFWWADRQAAAESHARLSTVSNTLADTSFPITPQVLEILQTISGLEFVVCDAQANLRAHSAGLNGDDAMQVIAHLRNHEMAGQAISNLAFTQRLQIGSRLYRATTLLRPSSPDGLMILLEPQDKRQAQLMQLALMPLLTGLATLLLVGAVALMVSQRLIQRIGNVEMQVQRIASNQLEAVTVTGPDDEVASLARSVNSMASELRSVWRTIRETERSRLLSQVASGLAHQLRNAITGIHLAVQLHRRDCPLENQESLAVAESELARTAAYIQQLLHSAAGKTQTVEEAPLGTVMDQAQSLLETIATHRRIALRWQRNATAETLRIKDSQLLRSAVMNLVLNALDAAGASGDVMVETQGFENGATRIVVSDSGPGPLPEMSQHIFDPFVSSKPEGLGVGLAVVRSAAETFGGQVRWHRQGNRTVFEFDLPLVEEPGKP